MCKQKKELLSRSRINAFHGKFKRVLHKNICEHERMGVNLKILDVGCGNGNDLLMLESGNEKLVTFGIDISLSKLSAAKKTNNTNRFVLANAMEIPFIEGAFDVVFSSEMIEHINKEEVGFFMKELHRVLKPGGMLIVTTPSKYNYATLLSKLIPASLKRRLRRGIWYLRPGKENNPHAYEYSIRELKQIFLCSNFHVEKIECGVMRIPSWPLFLRHIFLLRLWKALDNFIGVIPGGLNLKHNIVLVARKRQ